MQHFQFDFSKLSKQPKAVSPNQYIIDPALASAVSVAISLNQPLLLTGEPGTGKTRLAHKIAWDLHQQNPEFLPEPLVFHTKTTAVSQDMFYHYDAMRHFHDANIKKALAETAPPTENYIELRALGKAIALTQAAEIQKEHFVQSKQTRSSVVLIDEIDKAPRDFPNDILHEIENMEFAIKEANNHRISRDPDHHIVIIMTSNSEKNLPEAFLRRCVFYHIPFPPPQRLLEIVRSHFGDHTAYADYQLIEHFQQIRQAVRKKKPATAELIAWLRVLELNDFLAPGLDLQNLSPSQKQSLRMSYSVLAKTQEDLKAIESQIGLS
ncbi:MAG: MoxR family ATPase [Bacteroidota bacterium]